MCKSLEFRLVSHISSIQWSLMAKDSEKPRQKNKATERHKSSFCHPSVSYCNAWHALAFQEDIWRCYFIGFFLSYFFKNAIKEDSWNTQFKCPLKQREVNRKKKIQLNYTMNRQEHCRWWQWWYDHSTDKIITLCIFRKWR